MDVTRGRLRLLRWRRARESRVVAAAQLNESVLDLSSFAAVASTDLMTRLRVLRGANVRVVRLDRWQSVAPVRARARCCNARIFLVCE